MKIAAFVVLSLLHSISAFAIDESLLDPLDKAVEFTDQGGFRYLYKSVRVGDGAVGVIETRDPEGKNCCPG